MKKLIFLIVLVLLILMGCAEKKVFVKCNNPTHFNGVLYCEE